MASDKIKVRERQTIWDVCLQVSGGIDGVFDLAELNGFDIDTPLYTGQILNTGIEIQNQQIVDYYAKNEIHPSNGMTQAEMADLPADFHWPDFHEIDFEAA